MTSVEFRFLPANTRSGRKNVLLSATEFARPPALWLGMIGAWTRQRSNGAIRRIENRRVSRDSTSSRRAIVAYVAPFVLYIVLTMVESKGWLGLNYETVCTLKGLLVAAALWIFRREYPALATKGCGLAIVAGGAGCIVWIVLERVQAALPAVGPFLDSLMPGARVKYDPFTSPGPAAARMAFVIMRLIEMTAVVPIMEEIFWRGFLARFLLADDFRNVPQGIFTPWSFLIVVLAFAALHPEILAAVAWCTLINLLYRRTANLWACVVMHAVTNGLLGGYILATGSWYLW
jgi:CAAX prenyl protease-like protein